MKKSANADATQKDPRRNNERIIRSPRGTVLSAKSWLTEAPLRMLMNNLDFFGGNPSAIGNENQLSTSTEFICWEEVAIEAINPDLTTTLMGRKGVFVSAPATKVGIFGVQDDTGPTTLLGLSEVREGSPAAPTRAYFGNLFNSSRPVPTRFVPTPSPNFLP